jgi:hypothetical protein
LAAGEEAVGAAALEWAVEDLAAVDLAVGVVEALGDSAAVAAVLAAAALAEVGKSNQICVASRIMKPEENQTV